MKIEENRRLGQNNEDNEVIINGCKVIDKGNGLSSFVCVDDQPAFSSEVCQDGFFAKMYRWLKGLNVKPYAKFRDLADPLWKRRNDPDDIDVGSDGKTAAEVGIKVEF